MLRLLPVHAALRGRAVIVINIIAMALALGLNAKIKWRTGIRAVFFIPMVMSALIVAYVFNFLFSTSVPTIATASHRRWRPASWPTRHWAWLAIVIVTVWQAIPGTHHHLPRRPAGDPDATSTRPRRWTARAPGGSSAA